MKPTLIDSTLYLQKKEKKKKKISHNEVKVSFFFPPPWKQVTTYTQIKEAYGKYIHHCQQECRITPQTSLSCFLIKASRLMPCPSAEVNIFLLSP